MTLSPADKVAAASVSSDSSVEEPFTEVNWSILMAIMDTVIPSIRKDSTESNDLDESALPDIEYDGLVDQIKSTATAELDSQLLNTYLAENPSSIPRFRELLRMTFTQFVPEESKKKLNFFLGALNTRIGSFMLTGYTTPFQEQPLQIRNSILERWRLSYLPSLNIVYRQMSIMAQGTWLKSSPTFPPLAGFFKPARLGIPAPSFEYNFMQFAASEEPEIIEVDVVIVGSGCGGAVCAKNLAEAGYRVLVVEKSYHYPASQMPMTEDAAWIKLFDNGGVQSSDDGSITLVAGSTWGGGGTINWSASLQTQGFVRKEWADQGLTFFETAEFQNCLDRVCERMGVSTEHIRHNFANKTLLEGARRLGYNAQAVPQNTGGEEHYCGLCTLGCQSGGKQGPAVTFLTDAARAGARFIEGFEVERVLFDEDDGGKVAIGVKGTWMSRVDEMKDGESERVVREVIVRAPKVIISSGTLWSPIILSKSGLTNPQIGRNLHLHPVNTIAAIYPDDVRPWEGSILTSVCTSLESLSPTHHGVKLETTTMLPSFYLPLLNRTSGAAYKSIALRFRNMVGFIAIARDRDTGYVYQDPVDGKPRFQYRPSDFDRAHLAMGTEALAKMAYVTGAVEIHGTAAGMRPFVRDASPPRVSAELSSSLGKKTTDLDPGVKDPAFQQWLAELRKVGNKSLIGTFTSAHQMGTNRMSGSEKEGVVDGMGRVWGTSGLWVADASVFPSASGVNPMITVLAVADWISKGIIAEERE